MLGRNHTRHQWKPLRHLRKSCDNCITVHRIQRQKQAPDWNGWEYTRYYKADNTIMTSEHDTVQQAWEAARQDGRNAWLPLKLRFSTLKTDPFETFFQFLRLQFVSKTCSSHWSLTSTPLRSFPATRAICGAWTEWSVIHADMTETFLRLQQHV